MAERAATFLHPHLLKQHYIAKNTRKVQPTKTLIFQLLTKQDQQKRIPPLNKNEPQPTIINSFCKLKRSMVY